MYNFTIIILYSTSSIIYYLTYVRNDTKAYGFLTMSMLQSQFRVAVFQIQK